jgi:hypothetical protein
MPRFVRPAWIDVSADGAHFRGTGPRTLRGFLTAMLTLRTTDGTVSPAIEIRAGGSYRDGSGRIRLRDHRTGRYGYRPRGRCYPRNRDPAYRIDSRCTLAGRPETADNARLE